MMAHIMLLLLPCVMSARTRLVPPGYETVSTRDANMDSHKVLTVKGKECKFPFRQGGSIHHHCINKTSSRPWCSLTHNFDRDLLWDYCAPPTAQPTEFVHASRRFTDPCRFNPCQNGGVCTLVPHRLSFECSCPDNFTGSLCELRKCYEAVHLRFYDIGESWGRVHLRNVEQCECMAGQIFCKRAHYTVCRENPCMNEGSCRRISTTGEEVCACRPGHSGANCDIAPAAECYRNKGTDYRGVVATTLTGARCLPWNSKLLHDELCVDSVDSAPLRGLGEHSYCRNPDGDKMPWCYTLNDGAISWEHCDVPSCVIRWEFHLLVKAKKMRRAAFLSRRKLPALAKTNFTTTAKKPVCGKKHKKRLSRARIMGGTTSLPGTHPWMAAMYIGDDSFCAGTLVSSCWVVSAAHCFFRSPLVSKIRVVLGQQNFNVTNPNTRTFGVEKYIFPKQFSVFNPTLHDIVLVKLKKENERCVRRTQFIRPICLPDKDMKFPDNYCCQITGWGHMNEKANKYSNLQEAGVRIIPHEKCTQPEIYGNHVTSNMICAGNVCEDACQGDSGGPLACVKDDVSFLYGIISWGDGCGRTNKPGVYTKVVKYVPWINQIISRKPKS